MTELLSVVEAAPTAYPTYTPPSYPAIPIEYASQRLSVDTAWQRIESYIAYRYSARTVTWTLNGPGGWKPPLGPVISIDTTEVWSDGWVATTLDAAPLGYTLEANTYRVTATVGGGAVPATVTDAMNRLFRYCDEAFTIAGVSGTKRDELVERGANWLARALIYSGAADLLRPYRTVK